MKCPICGPYGGCCNDCVADCVCKKCGQKMCDSCLVGDHGLGPHHCTKKKRS